jgi:hypothetical protein
MPDDWIKCPECGANVQLTKALTGPIEARLRAHIEHEVTERAADLTKKENALKLREGKLKETVEAELKNRLATERKGLREQVEGDFVSRVKELEGAVSRVTSRAEKSEKAERELRASKDKLEEREKNLDLEIGRQVEEATKTIQGAAQASAAEGLALKEQEHTLQIDGLNRQVAELQQKLTQGSEQRQGDAMEVQLEEELRSAFPTDLIEPVPTGTRGADIVQRVRTPSGQVCGTIVWESKRTKDWHEDWITKLKEDAGRLHGDASILVSRALPDDVRTFALRNGVAVTNFGSALPVAALVRLRLLEVARQKRVDETSAETRDQLYQYLTSPEFVSRIESVVIPLAAMRADLDSEVRAIESRWKKRRKEIERAERSIVGMYGDLRGIVGGAKLPEVAPLALPDAPELPAPEGDNRAQPR